VTTEKETATTAAAVPASPPVIESERSSKITCVMLERQAAYLDVICVLFRMRHQKAVARSAIIRALIEFMQRSGVDYSQFASANAIVVYLVKHFQTVARPGELPRLLESSFFPSRGRIRPPERKTAKSQTGVSHCADSWDGPV